MTETAIQPSEAAPAAAVEASAPDIAVVTATPQPVVIEVVAEAAAEAPSEAVSGVEIAQADAAEDIAEAPVAAEAGDVATADHARSRAEQLRGLFDSARNDAAQDEAATEAGRNA